MFSAKPPPRLLNTCLIVDPVDFDCLAFFPRFDTFFRRILFDALAGPLLSSPVVCEWNESESNRRNPNGMRLSDGTIGGGICAGLGVPWLDRLVW